MDVAVRAEEGEANKAMEACRISKEEKMAMLALPIT